MAEETPNPNNFEKFDKQEACDVHFNCRVDQNTSTGKIFKVIGAHKAVLSQASPIFDSMFNGKPIARNLRVKKMEDYGDPISLLHIKYSTFYHFLSFIYGGKIIFDDIETAMDFYNAAQLYFCKDALKFVSQYLIATMNPFALYDFAAFYLSDDLKHAAIKKFCTLDQEQIFGNDNIIHTQPKTINEIFTLLGLKIENEMILVDAIDRYIKFHEIHDREIVTKVHSAIRNIRYRTLSFKEIIEISFLSEQEKIGLLHSLPPNPNFDEYPHMFTRNAEKRGSKPYKEEVAGTSNGKITVVPVKKLKTKN